MPVAIQQLRGRTARKDRVCEFHASQEGVVEQHEIRRQTLVDGARAVAEPAVAVSGGLSILAVAIFIFALPYVIAAGVLYAVGYFEWIGILEPDVPLEEANIEGVVDLMLVFGSIAIAAYPLTRLARAIEDRYFNE